MIIDPTDVQTKSKKAHEKKSSEKTTSKVRSGDHYCLNYFKLKKSLYGLYTLTLEIFKCDV